MPTQQYTHFFQDSIALCHCSLLLVFSHIGNGLQDGIQLGSESFDDMVCCLLNHSQCALCGSAPHQWVMHTLWHSRRVFSIHI